MTQLSQTSPKRPRQILATPSLSPQEIAQRNTLREELAARCRVIFERLRPELIEEYYDWFIAIDPDQESYIIDPKLDGLIQRIRQQYQDGETKLTIYRLNEKGVCGRI